MPLATVCLSLEGDGARYALSSTPYTDLLGQRIAGPILDDRIRRLSVAAERWTPSPMFNLLPFMAPWFMIFPVLAVTHEGANGERGGGDDDGEGAGWTFLVIICTLAFFFAMAAGPVHIHRSLLKRHEAVKALLTEFTLLDAFQSDRHLVWRFTHDDNDGWHSELYETTVEIVILSPSDCVDEHGNVVSLEAIFAAANSTRGIAPGTAAAILDPDIVHDPPPAYAVMAAASEKPPEYSLMPYTLFDAEYELHAIHSELPPSSSAGLAAPAAESAAARSRAGSSSEHLAGHAHHPAAAAAIISRSRVGSLRVEEAAESRSRASSILSDTSASSSNFEEVDVRQFAPPPRSSSLYHTHTPSLPWSVRSLSTAALSTTTAGDGPSPSTSSPTIAAQPATLQAQSTPAVALDPSRSPSLSPSSRPVSVADSWEIDLGAV
ncbi:hypothetical protein H9P43_001638 [Blastocladiella emersonii ATCC 22665]|nr:hypothetical protein H9P43_001638 [Blastocladiella emersonii ATCC 22665]